MGSRLKLENELGIIIIDGDLSTTYIPDKALVLRKRWCLPWPRTSKSLILLCALCISIPTHRSSHSNLNEAKW